MSIFVTVLFLNKNVNCTLCKTSSWFWMSYAYCKFKFRGCDDITCILQRGVCVFVMVVFMCDACVFAVMGFSTKLWYRSIYGRWFFVAANIANNLIVQ